jgi:hypothetical protein
MENQGVCPWCNENVVYVEETHNGTYGTIRKKKCPKCGSLVSTRLKEIPDTIIKKKIGDE